jgi:hypothetical protein
MFRVIVAGSRSFTDYDLLREHMDKLLMFAAMKDNIQIVCGGARGADSLGEQYAKERGYDIAYFPADWDAHGKSAGYKRNAQMADNADALVAFWDGQSPGTKSMIALALSRGLKVKVKRYQQRRMSWRHHIHGDTSLTMTARIGVIVITTRL